MKYAYIPATIFQKQIYFSDLTSVNGKFTIVWCWNLNTSISSEIIAPYLRKVIDKYEILRTTIVNDNNSILQKIAQSVSCNQVLLKDQFTSRPDSSFLKDLAEPSEGITFIIDHDSSCLVNSIYGVASHSIIDATSIELLRSELCSCLNNGVLPPHIYEFQFADLTDSLDSLEQRRPELSILDDTFGYDSPLQSLNLDSTEDVSSIWLSPTLSYNEFLLMLPSDVQLSTLGRLFQYLISKLGVFLNRPVLHVGLALDARNFLDLSSLVGPAVLIKKGAFNIQELNNRQYLNHLAHFCYETDSGLMESSLISSTDRVEVLFNLIVTSRSSTDSAPLVSADFINNRGANVPLTLDCHVNTTNDQFQIFLRSNSSTLNSSKLCTLGNYFVSPYESMLSKYISPFDTKDLTYIISSSLERGGSSHCLHWIKDSDETYFTYDQLRCRVEIYQQFLLHHQISGFRILTRCLEPFEYIASILALVLTNNIFVPLDERRSNDVNRVDLIESICDYELKFDLNSLQPILLPLSVGVNASTDENPSKDLCLMFTSGSSGSPKGVRVTAKGILRLLQLGIEQSWDHSNFLMHSDIGFDASLFEIWIPILSGGKITCIDHLLLMSKGIFVDVDCCWISVSMLTQLLKCTHDILKAKVICTGGEHVPYSLVATIESCGFFEDGNQLFNGYGPTESTTFIFLDEINPRYYAQSEGTMSHLLPGSKVSLQSFLGVETPVGGIGELIVSGDGVANGYINSKPDSAFFYNCYNDLSYRTGDFFERVTDASYRFIGRADDVIKLSGYRVSIEQVRSNLSTYLKSSDVFVLKIIDQKQSFCVGFVQSSGLVTEEYISNAIKSMRLSVPHYLIPKEVILIKDIPITPNGKVDRNALVNLYMNASVNVSTLITVEQLLSDLSSLGKDSVFDISHLTQDSLSLVYLNSRLRDIGFTIDLYTLSNCINTSDLDRVLNNEKTSLAIDASVAHSSFDYPDYILSIFKVDIISFDRVSLLCFLTTLFETFSFDTSQAYYLIENSFSTDEYLKILRESSFLSSFPICCTYSINESVIIRFYSTSSYFSIFALEEIAKSTREYLLFKGTVLSRLSSLKRTIQSFSDSFILRDTSVTLKFVLASIFNSSLVFDSECYDQLFVFLPSPSSHSIKSSLFTIHNGQLLISESTPGPSDIIYYIRSINDTESFLSSSFISFIVEGSLSNTKISWYFDDVTLDYYFPRSEEFKIRSFRSPPSSWRSDPIDTKATSVIIISPVADDLLPVLPLAKAFASKGYFVHALTYGLLNLPSFDTVELQSQRVFEYIEPDKPFILIGYSYSGLIVNYLSSIYESSKCRFVVVDTPNPQLLQSQLELLPSNDRLFWLSQVSRRLLKSIDCEDLQIKNIIDFIEQSSSSFLDIVNEVRYRLIELGAISYSTAVDDFLCWIDSSQAQFYLFRSYQLKSSNCQATYVCANSSENSKPANQSWDSYWTHMKVINVQADHYTILKSTKICNYIDDLVYSLL